MKKEIQRKHILTAVFIFCVFGFLAGCTMDKSQEKRVPAATTKTVPETTKKTTLEKCNKVSELVTVTLSSVKSSMESIVITCRSIEYAKSQYGIPEECLGLIEITKEKINLARKSISICKQECVQFKHVNSVKTRLNLLPEMQKFLDEQYQSLSAMENRLKKAKAKSK